MITFDLALGHGVVGLAPGVADALLIEVLLQVHGQVAGPIVR